jgi:hypothetical protein
MILVLYTAALAMWLCHSLLWYSALCLLSCNADDQQKTTLAEVQKWTRTEIGNTPMMIHLNSFLVLHGIPHIMKSRRIVWLLGQVIRNYYIFLTCTSMSKHIQAWKVQQATGQTPLVFRQPANFNETNRYFLALLFWLNLVYLRPYVHKIWNKGDDWLLR